MYAAEAAVAHNQHMVAALGKRRQIIHETVKIAADMQLAAQRCQSSLHIPIHAAGIAEHRIGRLQAARQRGLHRAKLHGIGTRLQHGHNPRAAHFLPQSGNGGFNRGRVVGKIVIHGDAACHPFYFHAPFHIFKFAQRGTRLRHRHAGMTRGGNHGQRV